MRVGNHLFLLLTLRRFQSFLDVHNLAQTDITHTYIIPVVSDIAVFVLKRDVKLQLTHPHHTSMICYFSHTSICPVIITSDGGKTARLWQWPVSGNLREPTSIINIGTSRLVFMAWLRPQFRTPPSFDRCTPPRRRFNQNIPPTVVLLQQCHYRNRRRENFKIYFLRQFCSNGVKFFYNTLETQTQKMMD